MKRDEKTGEITWDPAEEAAIEAGAEARYRATKRLEKDKQSRACKRGDHDFDEGVCICGVKEDEKPPKPEPKKKTSIF